MNISDLIGHTFHQALSALEPWKGKLAAFVEFDRVVIEGTANPTGIVNELIDTYLRLLTTSEHPSDRALLDTFSQSDIRAHLRQVLDYHQVPPPGTMTLADLQASSYEMSKIHPLNLAYRRFKIHTVYGADHTLHIEGSEPADGFIDRLADAYLELLTASERPLDQALRVRLAPEEIRANFHRLIKYTYSPHGGGVIGQSLELDETPPQSFWQRLTSWF